MPDFDLQPANDQTDTGGFYADGTTKFPATIGPVPTDNNNKVGHITQIQYVGSKKTGQGVAILSETLQWYTGRADYLNITSPVPQ